jgi:hypothetical protein
MSKIFYDQITIVEEIETELNSYQLSSDEKSELLSLVDQTVHHEVLNTILTHLPKEKHEHFLTKFHAAPHDKALLDYLKKEIKIDIEKEIFLQAKKIKRELLAEIKRAKK